MTRHPFVAPTSAATPRELLTIPHIRKSLANGSKLCATNRDQYVAAPTTQARGNIARQAFDIMQNRLARRRDRAVAEAARQHCSRGANWFVAQARAKRIAAVRDIVAEIDCRLFRVSGSRWVGGDHTVEVDLITHPFTQIPTASGESSTVWHKKKSWKGTNSRRRYLLPADWIATVHAAGIAELDDRLTLWAERVPTDRAEAAWRVITARQSAGFDLKTETGFVVMFAGVIRFGKTIDSAKRKCAAEWKPVFSR